MSKIQLEGILKLIDVEIDPTIYQKISRATGSLPAAFQKAGGAAGTANASITQLGNSVQKVTKQLQFGDVFAQKFLQRMAQFAILLPIFSTLNKAIQGGVKFLADFESELINIQRIDPKNLTSRLSEIADASLSIGANFGVSAAEVLKSIRVFVQAGDSIEEAMDKAKVAAIATQVSMTDLGSAQQALIHISREFSDQALTNIGILDKLTKVADESGSSAGDLGDAFTKGGNALAFAFKSFDAALGSIAAIRLETGKSVPEITTAMGALAARIYATGKSSSALEQLGVAITDQTGRLRPLQDILKDTKQAFDGLSESEQANAAKTIAGVRQFNVFLAALHSVDKAQELTTDSANSAGESMKRMEVVQNKLSFQTQQMIVEFQKLAEALGEAGVLDFFKEAVKTASSLAQVLTSLVNISKGLGINFAPLLLAGGLKLGQAAFGLGKTAIGGAVSALGGGGPQALIATQQARTPFTAGGGLSLEESISRDLNVKMKAMTVEQQKAIVQKKAETAATQKAILSFIAFTGAAAMVNSFTKILEDASKNVGHNTKTWTDALISSSDALSTGLQTAAVLGVKAGALAALFDITARSLSTIVSAINDEIKARKEIVDAEKQFAAGRGLAEAAAGNRGTAGTDIVEKINKAFQVSLGKSGGTTGGNFATSVQAQLKTIFDGIDPKKNPALADLKNLDLADVFGNKAFLTAVGQSDTSLKNLNKAIQNNAGVSQLLTSYEADMYEAAKKAGLAMKDLGDQVLSLSQIKDLDKLRQSEDTIYKLLQERQEINRTDIPLFETEVETLKRRAAATKNFLDVAGAAKSDLLHVAQKSPGELGFVGKGADDRATHFVENIEEAFNKAGKGGEFQLTKFLDDLSKTKTGNIEDAAKSLNEIGEDVQNITPDNINKMVTAARDFVEVLQKGAQDSLNKEKILKDLRDASAKAAVETAKLDKANIEGMVEALNNAQLALIHLGIGANVSADDLTKVSKLTDKDFTDIINGTDNFDEGIRNLIKTIGGTELQRVQENTRISTTSLAKEMEILEAKIADTKKQLANTSGGFNQMSGKSAVQLTEELNRLENQGRTLELEATQDSIKDTLELIKTRREADIAAINNARELKKAMDSVAEAEFKLTNGTEDAAKSFREFANEQSKSLLSEDAQAQNKLKEAEQGVITATKGVNDAYKGLRDAILAFNDSMANAQVEVGLMNIQAKSLGGSADNASERIAALNKAFGDAMKDANISLRERLDLEKKLADDTLAFLQKAQDQIVGAGLNVFGQTTQQNSQLAQGIAGLQFAADKLGGSFDKFSALSPQALDQIGQSLLSLPQSLRQNMLDALRTLPSTTKIGGFSPEQLQTALGQVGTGVSAQEGLPAVADLIKQEKDQLQKIQDTTIKQADLQINQVVAALNQVDTSKQQLEQAKIMDQRARDDAVSVRDKIIEQTTVLHDAADQREKLTAQILQAEDADTIRQIEAQARGFASHIPYYKDIADKLTELINSIGGLKTSQLDTAESLQTLQTQQQNTGAAGYSIPSDQSQGDDTTNAAFGYIPNFAAGKLTSGEVVGLIKAAGREKSAMPPGAGLAIANTSEMIIPTRSKGFVPNFAFGHGNIGSPIAAGIDAIKGINQTVAAAIASSVSKSLTLLQTGNSATGGDTNRLTIEKLDKILNSLQELNTTNTNISTTLSAANTQTTPNQQAGAANKIDVTVNGQNTVTVTGLDNLKQTLSDAVKKANDQTHEKTIAPINDAIQQVFQALKERGIVNSFGNAS